nr:hypothetical protein [Tanacetum cinerariifolium]
MDVEEPILDDVVNDANQPQDDADLKKDKSTGTKRKYYASITKTKAARYELEGIEEMIPRLWSPIKVAYDRNAELGIYHWGPKQEIVVRRADQKEYTFKEGDLPRLHLNDIEDMFPLHVQNKVFNLPNDDIVNLVISLRMFTQSIIIKKKVEDVKLGVESYQKKLNITKPQTTFDEILFKEPCTTTYYPKWVVYLNKGKQKRLMRADELYKFSNGMLKSVRMILHERNSIGLDEAIEKGEIDPAIVLKRKRGDDEDQDPLMCCSK